MMRPFLQHFVIISLEWFEMIVWTQSNLIFEQSSVDFMLISYCIIKWIANFIGSTPIHGRVGGWRKKKHGGRRDDRVMDSIFGFDFWPIHLAIQFELIDTRRYKYIWKYFKIVRNWNCPPTVWEALCYDVLYRKTVSLYRMCAREMASFGFFNFWAIQ